MLGRLFPVLGLKIILYPFYTHKHQKRIQEKRLRKLVKYAKKNSPMYAELYKNIGENYRLEDLPITNKQMLRSKMNECFTDPEITKEKLREYMLTPGSQSKAFLGKYVVATTSGSTGYPVTVLYDKFCQNVTMIISFLRGTGIHFPLANICIDDGFGIDNSIIDKNTTAFPLLKKFVRVINSNQPYESIADDLNKFQPKIMIGYTGMLLLLSEQVKTGRLKIAPKIILCGGEYLSETSRIALKQAFGCMVHSIYACTEAGTIAAECKYERKHINTDWTIIEAVDENYKPVPPGTCSEKLLLTNLSNYVQPLIRFEITDRVIVHEGKCECGSMRPWIEVEGRTNDILEITTEGKTLRFSPMVLFDAIDIRLAERAKNYQVVIHNGSLLEIRILCITDEDRDGIFKLLSDSINEYLNAMGMPNVECYLSDILPRLNPVTGKFKNIFVAEEEENTDGLGRVNQRKEPIV